MLQTTILDDIAEAIGYTPTCALVAWYGGRHLYVPQRAVPGHPLGRVIGAEALARLVEAFPGETLLVPVDVAASRFVRDRQICERLAEGWTTGRIAHDLQLTVRRVEQIRAEIVARGWASYAAGGMTLHVGPGRSEN